jgi:folate-dependent phosphoribosylglycinamide formyltransferase PurN
MRVVPDLNHDRSIEFVRASACDGVLYAGGGIIRGRFIDAARGRILNPHSGPLPEIRGMNACEWALLLGLPPAVTIHFIDEGIDTGGVVSQIPIGVEQGDTVESLRGKCVVAGINGIAAGPPGAWAAPPAATPARSRPAGNASRLRRS